jgi:hypothetical protein
VLVDESGSIIAGHGRVPGDGSFYGLEYGAEWRKRAGVSTTERIGRIENNHRADWREAWALFPDEVAYVWHAGIYATTVAEGLLASGFSLCSQII